MASRPLPPGRRGRGGRTVSAQHLPEIKILNVEQQSSTTTASSYVEQLRVATSNDKAAVEPEHESNAQEEAEPTPVRSVKAFVATLDRAEEPIAAPVVPVAVVEDVKPQADAPEVEAPPVVMSPPAVVFEAPVAQPVVQVEPEIQFQLSAPTVIEPPAIQPTPLPPVHEVYAPVLAPVEAAPVATAPVAVKTAPPSVEAPVVEGFHPVQLLLPVHSVPIVPEQVECVYDDEAVEMQKTIMKVIKKHLGKDRAKLEDFKINSRLYGNNFMDAHEYLDSLAKDLGGNRALQLVPCLLSIQPDFMKRSSLLVAARNYRMRNLAKLEAALDSEVAALPELVQPAAQPAPVAPAEPVAPTVASITAAAPAVAALVEVVVPSIPSSSAGVPVVEEHIYETVAVEAESVSQGEETTSNEADAVVDAPTVIETDERPVEQPAICEAEPPADLYVPPVEEAVAPPATAVDDAIVDQDASVAAELEELAASEVSVEDAAPVEPSPPTVVDATSPDQVETTPIEAAQVQAPVVMDEAKAAAALMPVTIDVSPIELGTRQISYVSAQSVATPTLSENSSTSSAEAEGLSLFQEVAKPVQPAPVRKQSTLNLFGEDLGDDDDDEDDEDEEQDKIKIVTPVPVSTIAPAAAPVPRSPPSSPASSSFFEAESLFGEVIPVKVTAPPAPHAEVPSIIAPAPLPPPVAIRPQHSGMLFGFGTAGDDSDSDSDSEFSD